MAGIRPEDTGRMNEVKKIIFPRDYIILQEGDLSFDKGSML